MKHKFNNKYYFYTIRFIIYTFKYLLVLICVWFFISNTLLFSYLFIHPPISSVQLKKIIRSNSTDLITSKTNDTSFYSDLSDDISLVFIAAEDPRFCYHNGVDWNAVWVKFKEARRKDKPYVGASTITQQLIKNLFLSNHRSYIRKALELSLVPSTEFILSKERILKLYLSIVEFDKNVYGLEAASQHYYNISASELNKEQAARLAAVLPAPKLRDPDDMDSTSTEILNRYHLLNYAQ